MRSRLVAPVSVVLTAVLALLVGACSSGPAAADPYDLVIASSKTSWDPIQVNVGFSATVDGTTVKIDPSAVALVIDSAGGKGAVHVSLSAIDLKIPATTLAQLGVTGGSIDFDLVYAADALYARSAMLKPVLTFVLGPSGKIPAGDLTGWLKLGTKEELSALAALSGGATAVPSAAAPSITAQSLKTQLDAAGITLTSAGTETHKGADAQHVKVAIDTTKLAANPNFAAGAGAQYAQAAAALRAATVSGDLWIAPSSKRIVEVDLHIASTTDTSQAGDMTVLLRDPDGSVPLDAPASSVNVPISTLIWELMKLIGNGAES